MNDKRMAGDFNYSKVGAFLALYDSYFAALCVFSHKYVNDMEEAVDIVQDVFVVLWQKRGDFSSEAVARSFLYTAVRNRSLNYIKHKNMKSSKADDIARTMTEEAEATAIISAETARHNMLLLEKLPSECRTVLRLTIEGKSYKEIAHMLGITVSTVRNHRVRAVKKLRALMIKK